MVKIKYLIFILILILHSSLTLAERLTGPQGPGHRYYGPPPGYHHHHSVVVYPPPPYGVIVPVCPSPWVCPPPPPPPPVVEEDENICRHYKMSFETQEPNDYISDNQMEDSCGEVFPFPNIDRKIQQQGGRGATAPPWGSVDLSGFSLWVGNQVRLNRWVRQVVITVKADADTEADKVQLELWRAFCAPASACWTGVSMFELNNPNIRLEKNQEGNKCTYRFIINRDHLFFHDGGPPLPLGLRLRQLYIVFSGLTHIESIEYSIDSEGGTND